MITANNHTKNILDKLEKVKQVSDGWLARCPVHGDENPSLSIGIGDGDKTLLYCHSAGCSPEAIVRAIGLTTKDLFPNNGHAATGTPPRKNNRTPVAPGNGSVVKKTNTQQPKKIVKTYDYRDETGNLIMQVLKYKPKDFRQRQPKQGGGWNWSVKGLKQIPYRLPEVIANQNRMIAIVEGEKDVDRLAGIDVVATCNAGGSGKWTDEHSEYLTGCDVVILPDNDQPGRKHAQIVAESLTRCNVKTIKVVKLPGLKEKQDVSDWIDAGGDKAALGRLVEVAEVWKPGLELWEKIDYFTETKLPQFPTDALPEPLRSWVEAEAFATQTPADMASLLSMAVCSYTISSKIDIRAREGWIENPNLYTIIILESGNRKSVVFSDVMKPLRDIETELIESQRDDIGRAKSERRQKQKRMTHLEQEAAKTGDTKAAEEARQLAAELESEIEPDYPRIILDDCTTEKIAVSMAQQGGRIMIASPEGGVFDLMAGKYSKIGQADIDIHLKAHNGDEVRVGRMGRPDIHIPRPLMTQAFAVQPAIVSTLHENDQFRGRGYFARPVYAVPKSPLGNRQINTEPVSDDVTKAYHELIRKLYYHTNEGSLRLTKSASQLFYEWRKDVEFNLGFGGSLYCIKDWGSKLPGETLRMAAIFHCIKHVDDDATQHNIERDSLESAIAISKYLIPHAVFVIDIMADKKNKNDPNENARHLLWWIDRHGKAEFSKRDIWQDCRRKFDDVDDLDHPIKTLVVRGYIRSILELKPKSAGRKPSPRYETNPEFFEHQKKQSQSYEKRTHNTHNRPDEHENGNSVDCVYTFANIQNKKNDNEWGEI